MKPEGEDELKKKQLMELAIINGTYRDSSKIQQKMNQILIPSNGAALACANPSIRSPPNPLGQPLIISPRMVANSAAVNNQLMNGAPTHQIIAQSSDHNGGILYTPIQTFYDPAAAALNAAAASQALLEYPNGIEFSQAGKFAIY